MMLNAWHRDSIRAAFAHEIAKLGLQRKRRDFPLL